LDFYYGSAHKGIMINLYIYVLLPPRGIKA
jgi:hypothetical protein